MFNAENAIKKWGPVLDHGSAPKIKDAYRRAVTATLLENQERAMKEERAHSLNEGTGATGNGGFDPILISLVRRAMPNLIAYDIAGVQPMSAPTGLIFALRSKYGATPSTGAEALFGGRTSGSSTTTATATGVVTNSSTNVVGTTAFSVTSLSAAIPAGTAIAGAGIAPRTIVTVAAGVGTVTLTISNPITIAIAAVTYNLAFESTSAILDQAPVTALGATPAAGAESTISGEMGFQIEKTTVTANTRALKAEYTMELAQDLKAVHGLDAESELANILSSEILLEINREVINKINTAAAPGGTIGGIANGTNTTILSSGGTFNMTDAAQNDGRWSVERYKGLLMQIEKDANKIAKDTRRGKGNFIVCSSNVASALAASGVLDYAPAMSTNLEVDDTGNSFAGILNGRIKVYIDPYSARDYVTIGYRGTNPYDAGMFYAPYVPLTMVRAIDPGTFQPRIAFKTRYGLVNNPFVSTISGNVGIGAAADGTNFYYRNFAVYNL